MEIDLVVTFSKEEIEAMVMERCSTIKTEVPGKFTVRPKFGYIPPVVAEFTPDPQPAPAEQPEDVAAGV